MATTDTSDDAEYEPHVMSTIHDDGTARFTVAMDDESHSFEATVRENQVSITFEESIDYRGNIRTAEPRQEVWDILTTSEEFQEFVSDF